jgi:aspartate/methionine/tyrosine aminotransferase
VNMETIKQMVAPLPGLKVAGRSNVAPFLVMDVLSAANGRAAAGEDVVHLEVGEPGGGPPEPVLEAARQALGRVPIGYTEALGRPALRAAIAANIAIATGSRSTPGR